MKQRVVVGIAAAALAVGIAGSAGVTGYMIGHHVATPTTASWHLDPADIQQAVDLYRQQQWEATKRWAQNDISASDDLLTPRRPASTRRDLTQRQRAELNRLQAQLDTLGGYR